MFLSVPQLRVVILAEAQGFALAFAFAELPEVSAAHVSSLSQSRCRAALSPV